ncbi:xanthine dehydrogenase family protein molybdopterin-binding subunit [SAR202 cluster bacterium AC-647-N09_OGT_505m]|nr:xanthine dehydrogenase family protein molybdopterin-binding subunit [SAR202 cluster bacterium AC-647-N09_OGT_505m]
MVIQGYRVVGTRPIRYDGVDKVTGRAQYGADIQMPRLLYGKVLRSPHAHARIKSIDTSKAKRHSSIQAVVTAEDFQLRGSNEALESAELTMSLKSLRDNILASDKVLYRGQPVAAVAAANPHDAEEALKLIEVEYEVLSPVLTAPDGMKENAPLLHNSLKTDDVGNRIDKVSNVASHLQHRLGNIEKGFQDADLVIEREFNTKTVHQGYIEPHNATAYWNMDGRVTIWCSTQGPFEVRDASAQALGLNVSDIRVIPMEIGGGFGGKFEPYGDPVAALLSRKSGHPVKIVMTRAEDLESTGPTPGSYIKVKMGATKDGKIIAAQAYLAYEAGAYPGSPVDAGAICVFGSYDIPNVLIDGFDVVVNKPKTAAYRAPGATNAAFASETVIDELAEKLGLDSLDLRLLNVAREGTRRADGPAYPRIGCEEVMEAIKEHPHYRTPLGGGNRGRGIALAYWMNGGGLSSCTIKVNADGTVNLNEGSPDIGGTRTSVAMQAAEVLGIPGEDVIPAVMDTDSIGYTSGTGGSSVTFKTGKSAYDAAEDVKRQMVERAARIWDVEHEAVDFEGGILRSKSHPELTMTFKELAKRLDDLGGPVVGSATTDGGGAGGTFAGCIVDVEVDPETGKVDILRFTMVQDAGKAIHPSYVEGQMQGGSVQGIGWALNEEYCMSENGQMMNSSLLDYRMPTSLDLPMIDTVIVEVPNPRHPFGVRGVGEVSIVTPPAAIANAIYRAIGVRMDKLPMNPGAVMESIWEQMRPSE